MVDEPIVPADPEERALDWRVYADATCAGLTPLIPLPFADLAAEAVFRRRMAGAIARARNRQLHPEAAAVLSRSHERWLSAEGCLKIPVFVLKYLARRLWRKVIYVFAVADAVEQTSLYWHRAALLDHIIRGGHAGPGVDLERTARVAIQTLRETDTSALKGVARRVIRGSGHLLRTLHRSRREGAVTSTPDIEAEFRANWQAVQRSLFRVAVRYNRLYAESLQPPPPAPEPPRPG